MNKQQADLYKKIIAVVLVIVALGLLWYNFSGSQAGSFAKATTGTNGGAVVQGGTLDLGNADQQTQMIDLLNQIIILLAQGQLSLENFLSGGSISTGGGTGGTGGTVSGSLAWPCQMSCDNDLQCENLRNDGAPESLRTKEIECVVNNYYSDGQKHCLYKDGFCSTSPDYYDIGDPGDIGDPDDIGDPSWGAGFWDPDGSLGNQCLYLETLEVVDCNDVVCLKYGAAASTSVFDSAKCVKINY